jgi:hypothetical protein
VAITSPGPPLLTMGDELERDRLEYRVRRVTVAIVVLRQLAGEHRARRGGPPAHVRRAIADFEAQIEAMNARLHDLAGEARATERPRESHAR